MKLCFETQPERTEGFELPMLVDAESIHVGEEVEALTVDGQEVMGEGEILQSITNAIAFINDEKLPEKHFRDCVSFAMGACGVWLPTHRPFDIAYNLEQTCNEDHGAGTDINGPVSTGIPNDDRCAGFGNANFVYSHMAFGLETSEGNLFVYKNGVDSEYFILPIEKMLVLYDHEVAHPVESVRVRHREEGELLRWDRVEQSDR